MKTKLLLMVMCCAYLVPQAQTLVTRTGYVSFFSKTPLEDIKAENRQVNAVVDLKNRNIVFAGLMKGFLFPKALMQEHFNENYVESDKYPKVTFVGTYTGDVDHVKDGTYPVKIKGNLTLHGVTRLIEVPATMTVKEGRLTGTSSFKIRPAEYNIKVPAIVNDKIAQQIDVAVKIDYNLSK